MSEAPQFRLAVQVDLSIFEEFREMCEAQRHTVTQMVREMILVALGEPSPLAFLLKQRAQMSFDKMNMEFVPPAPPAPTPKEKRPLGRPRKIDEIPDANWATGDLTRLEEDHPLRIKFKHARYQDTLDNLFDKDGDPIDPANGQARICGGRAPEWLRVLPKDPDPNEPESVPFSRDTAAAVERFKALRRPN